MARKDTGPAHSADQRSRRMLSVSAVLLVFSFALFLLRLLNMNIGAARAERAVLLQAAAPITAQESASSRSSVADATFGPARAQARAEAEGTATPVRIYMTFASPAWPTNAPAAGMEGFPTQPPSPPRAARKRSPAGPTDTPSPTPTHTATRTHTATFTATFTRTVTASPTASATKTRTPTRTATLTRTPSPTKTPTFTRTPTLTKTLTPTKTLTSTKTPTLTRTPTATKTPKGTVTSSPTATGTPTPTGMPSLPPIPTETTTPETETSSPTATSTSSPSSTPVLGLPACATGVPSGIPASDDTYIDSGSPAASRGTDGTFDVRPDNSADRRGLLKFDMASIPPGATVTGDTLHLYEIGNKAGQITSVHRITADWNESTATWQSWASPGGDFDGSATYLAYLPGQDQCMISLDITGLVQAWVSGVHPNYGLLLYSTGPDHTISYASGENENASLQPRLHVTYALP